MKGKKEDGCKLVACVSKALCPESVMGLTISWLRILTLLPNPAPPFPPHTEAGTGQCPGTSHPPSSIHAELVVSLPWR